MTQAVNYQDRGTTLTGFLAYDSTVQGKRPGVLVIHEWWGLNDYPKQRARELAGMGYVAFAADIYGGGQTTTDPAQAGQLAAPFRKDPALMRARARAGLEVLKNQSLVDPARLAAIGFCFGGSAVLELAWSGAELAGVVSFHGGLPAPKPEDFPGIKARVLVLHGADDPTIPPERLAEFESALRQSGADWVLVQYGGARHAFTNPAAGTDKTKPTAYDEKAARRSWEHLRVFFRELFAEGQQNI